MAKLSSRKLHIEIDAFIPQTDGYISRKDLPDIVKLATKAAIAVLRENGVPVEKTAWEYDYHYRSRNGHGAGTFSRRQPHRRLKAVAR